MRQQNVPEADWDYLIVLDACRYDVFEDVYEEYLDGSLEKRRSPGSATPEWAAKAFPGEYDVAYLSANPFVNSLGTPLSEMPWGGSCDYDWAASDHFADVVDLWREAWDDEAGTVRPERVTAAVDEHRGTIEAADRTVVHYLQPHAPFLGRGRGRKVERIRAGFVDADESAGAGGDAASTGFDDVRERADGAGGPLASAAGTVRNAIEDALGRSGLAMKVGMFLELNPDALLGVGRDGARAAIERYYEENLRIALATVEDLVADLDGRVVVTSDHGEAFGENGVWEHHIETHIPALVEVPWLVVES